MNANVRSAIIGAMATVVVSAAFAPRLLSDDPRAEVRFRPSSEE